ncbi:MAG: Uncharacterised protein [Synechococcus sp. CC9902]|nr:MAG: Uncharacterised protein [Synechococcus sp. CC9902]
MGSRGDFIHLQPIKTEKELQSQHADVIKFRQQRHSHVVSQRFDGLISGSWRQNPVADLTMLVRLNQWEAANPALTITGHHQRQFTLVIHPGFQQPVVGFHATQQLSQLLNAVQSLGPLAVVTAARDFGHHRKSPALGQPRLSWWDLTQRAPGRCRNPQFVQQLSLGQLVHQWRECLQSGTETGSLAFKRTKSWDIDPLVLKRHTAAALHQIPRA